MSSFQILPGLPPYGPEALSFSPIARGSHSEEFVIEFTADDGSNWIGNFQPGLTNCKTIVRHPNGRNYVVVTGGQAYIVDPNDPQSWDHFGGNIEHVFQIKELNSILFGNGLWFELFGADGMIWKSQRVSWDGMSDVAVHGLQLVGKSWSPDDHWHEFTLDLTDGSVEGGSYDSA